MRAPRGLRSRRSRVADDSGSRRRSTSRASKRDEREIGEPEVVGDPRVDVFDRAAGSYARNADPEAVGPISSSAAKRLGAATRCDTRSGAHADDRGVAVAHDGAAAGRRQLGEHRCAGDGRSRRYRRDYRRDRGVRPHRRTGAVPRRRARFRRERDRAARRGLGPRPHLPRRHRARRWASSGCSGCRSRRSTAARGADYLTYCIAIEEIARRRRVDGDHARSRREPRRRTVLLQRDRRAEAGVPRPDDRGRGARRVRAHRGRGRLRRRRDAHPCRRSTTRRTSG